MKYTDKQKLAVAVRLIKAMRNTEADTMKATSDVGMYVAKEELKNAELEAKKVGLKL